MYTFYLLELSVVPGGARKGDYYAFNTLDEIKNALMEDFHAHSSELYILLWYGETVKLYVYENSEIIKIIDILPKITVKIPDYPEMTFSEEGKLIGFDFDKDNKEKSEEETLSYKLFDGKIENYEVLVDWDTLDIPHIEGNIIDKEKLITVKYDRWPHELDLYYGLNNLEE